MPLFELTDGTKTFPEDAGGRFVAIHKATLSVEPGEFLAVVGPSGCGKSTLLRLLAGLDTLSSGRLVRDSSLTRADMGFVFQQFALFPWLTVEENIGVGLLALPLSAHEKQKRIAREMERLGLHQFRNVRPKELSGGLRQRVGIARAFVRQPRIVFMDEPFSELDSFTATNLRTELLALWQERKTTVVLVTHLIEEAVQLADRIAVMTPHPGTVEKVFSNTLPRPRELRSQEFFALCDEIYKVIQ
jgi:sulfonate transport system ATP-binding protein